MPSMETYRKLHSGTIGQEHKRLSDKIMDATWWTDINSRVGYLYDYYHDDHITQLNDLDSSNDPKKIPLDIKFLMNTSQTYGNDQSTFHLQMRPGQECNVEYYEQFFQQRYNSIFPIGLYIDIPDEQGKYNRWLVVDKANYNVTQFPTFEILRCDYVLYYIDDHRRKRQIAVVLQSQSSYNSGIWSDHVTTIVEDQQKFAAPLNRDTEKFYYNQRLIIDNKVLTEPRLWQISKINRIAPNGIARITLAQTKFDGDKDYVKIENDEVIEMYADYYVGNTEPNDFMETNEIRAEITYTGKPTIRVGSGYKKLVVNFYQGEEKIPLMDGQWQYFIGNEDVSSLIAYSTVDLEENEIKIKFNSKDTNYGGKTLTIKYVVNTDIQASVDLNLANL